MSLLEFVCGVLNEEERAVGRYRPDDINQTTTLGVHHMNALNRHLKGRCGVALVVYCVNQYAMFYVALSNPHISFALGISVFFARSGRRISDCMRHAFRIDLLI